MLNIFTYSKIHYLKMATVLNLLILLFTLSTVQTTQIETEFLKPIYSALTISTITDTNSSLSQIIEPYIEIEYTSSNYISVLMHNLQIIVMCMAISLAVLVCALISVYCIVTENMKIRKIVGNKDILKIC